MKIFVETQRFTQLWWLLFLGAINILVFYNLSVAYSDLKQSGDVFPGFVMPLVIILLVDLLFISLRLDTRIDEKGITYQMFPFHLKKRFVPWSALKDCYVRKYSPIFEYGGWGIRGLGKKTGRGMALNVNGNQGIQLFFKDGGKLLLGTQLPDKAQEVLNQYRHKLDVKSSENE